MKAKHVQYVSIVAKCNDSFRAEAQDSEGEVVGTRPSGYVPRDLLPGSGGDFVKLIIDIQTGQIMNWKKPTQKAMTEIFKG